MLSTCVGSSIRNQVCCNYYAVVVVFLLRMPLLQPESPCFLPLEESYVFSAFLTFFPRPPRRWEQTVLLSPVCVCCHQNSLFLQTDSPNHWEEPVPEHSDRRNSITTCLGGLFISLYWISEIFPGWMMIRGALSWTSQTWVLILILLWNRTS